MLVAARNRYNDTSKVAGDQSHRDGGTICGNHAGRLSKKRETLDIH